jgi:hypothetical protein
MPSVMVLDVGYVIDYSAAFAAVPLRQAISDPLELEL